MGGGHISLISNAPRLAQLTPPMIYGPGLAPVFRDHSLSSSLRVLCRLAQRYRVRHLVGHMTPNSETWNHLIGELNPQWKSIWYKPFRDTNTACLTALIRVYHLKVLSSFNRPQLYLLMGISGSRKLISNCIIKS